MEGFLDASPPSAEEQCGKDSNNATTLTPLDSNNADQKSTKRVSSASAKKSGGRSGIVPPSSHRIITSTSTPSKVLLAKLHSLEEQWSSQRSISSSYSRRSSSLADISSPSRQPTTATTADQSTHSEAEDRINRPLTSITTKPMPAGSGAQDERMSQDCVQTPMATCPHKESPQRSLRLFVDATSNEPGDTPQIGDTLNEISDHGSVGDSTISTLSSGGDSMFDRIPRNDIRKRYQLAGKAGGSVGSGRPNIGNSIDKNANSPQLAYTPKMSSVSRRRDRFGAFQTGSRNQHSQATPRAKTTTSSTDGGSTSANSANMKEKDDYSSFHRLYRNEKRSEKLWKATPPPGASDNGSSTRRGSRKDAPHDVEKDGEDYALYHRLHRNEKRPEKLWEATPSPSKETLMARNSSDDHNNNSDFMSFHRLHRNEKRGEKLWDPSRLGDSTVPAITTQQSSSATTTTTTGSSTSHSPITTHAKVSSCPHEGGRQEDEGYYRNRTPCIVGGGLNDFNEKTPMEMLQEELDATRLFDGDGLSLLSSQHSKDFSDHDEDLHCGRVNDNSCTGSDQSPPHRQILNGEDELSPLSQLRELSTLVEKSTKAFLLGESESPPTTSTESEISSSQPDFTPNEGAELPEPCLRSGFFSLDNPTGGLVMEFRAPAGKHFFAEKIEQLSAPAGRRYRRLHLSLSPIRGELFSQDFDETSMALTPTRLRYSSIVTIQNAWRCHRAQLSAASALLESWDVVCTLQPKLPSRKAQLRCHKYQTIGISQAIRQVDCWWILDGLQVDNDAVSVVWKKDLSFQASGITNAVTIRVKCEARRARFVTDSWGRRKISILLVKAALINALHDEKRRMRRCAAVVIQVWWLRVACVLTRPSISDNNTDSSHGVGGHLLGNPPEITASHTKETLLGDKMGSERNKARNVTHTSSIGSSPEEKRRMHLLNTGLRPQRSAGNKDEMDASLSDSAAAMRIQIWFRMMTLRARMLSRLSMPRTGQPLLSSDDNSDDHSAATTIQSWLRMAIVRSAFRSSHDFNQLDYPFQTSLSSTNILTRPPEALMLAAQRYDSKSQHRLPGQHQAQWKDRSDPFKRLSLGEAMVSDLAIRDVIRAYVASLRWYRRNRKATLIQSTFRGFRERRTYYSKKAAASRIQYEARRFWAFRAASKIQRIWKTRNAVKLLNDQRCSALKLQCFWRCHVAQHGFKKAVRAAIVLQRESRRRVSCQSFHSLRRAIIYLQRKWRRGRMRDLRSLETFSAVTVQSNWRRASAQWHFRDCRFAAVVVQSVTRSFIARSRFMCSIGSARTIQKMWRMHNARKQYSKMRASAMTVQGVWRRKVALWYFQDVVFAILNIQRIVRGCRARKHFLALVAATTSLQTAWRRKYAQRRLAMSLRSAVKLQGAWRGHEVRKQLDFETFSAATIQAAYRAHSRRTAFQCTRRGAMSIQRVYRGFKSRETLKRHIEAIRFIQKQWREHRRRMVEAEIALRAEELMASILLQRIWRGFRSRRIRDARLRSAISIQSQWRGSSARTAYTLERVSLVMIQALARGVIFRERRRVVHSKVVAVQKAWRGSVARLRIRKEQRITAIQRMWRMKKLRSEYIHLRTSAILIQSYFRMHMAMAKFASMMKCRRDSAALIQTKWRSSFAKQRYVHERKRVCTIQRVYRGYVCRKRCIEEQTLSVTMEHDVAVLLQCAFRSFLARRTVRFNRSVVLIQRSWRGALSRDYFSRARVAAVMLQSLIRFWLTSRSLQHEALRIRSIIRVQAHWRRSLSVIHYNCARMAATRIQSAIRRKRAMTDLNVSLLAVGTIQSYWRCSVARTSYVYSRSCTIMVQNRLRGFFVRKQYLSMRLSSLTIQRIWRGSLIRRQYLVMLEDHAASGMIENRNAALIQKSWRRHHDRFAFMSSRASAVFIQSHFRRHQAYRFVSQRRLARNNKQIAETNAVILLQATWRASQERSTYLITQSSVRRIQRSWIARKHRRRCAAATVIQQQWRGSIARAILADAIGAAIMIQALARGRMARWSLRYTTVDPEERKEVNEAARKIQVAFFMWKMELKLWEMRSSVILLQRSVRGQLVRSAARFALLHMNSSVQSSVLSSFARIVAASNHDVVSTTTAWNRAVTQARLFGCIIIQSSVRRMIARDYVRRSFGRSFGMSYLPAHVQVQRNSAASIIQEAFRNWKGSRAEFAAKSIQGVVRGWRSRRCLRKARLAATCIQAQSRGVIARRTYARKRWAIDAIQRTFRALLDRRLRKLRRAARKRRRQASLLQASAVKLQCAWRRSLAWNSYRQVKVAALFVQALIRLWIHRRLQAKNAAVVVIQCLVRKMLARIVFKERFITSGQKYDVATRGILFRIERQSEATVSNLLRRDVSSFSVDVGPCLHRLAYRVRSVESEAQSSADLCSNDVPEESLVGNGGLTADQVLGMTFVEALPLFLAAGDANIHVSRESVSPPRDRRTPDRSSPQSLSVESAVSPTTKASTPRRCNKSTGEAVDEHFALENEASSNTEPTVNLDTGANKDQGSSCQNEQNISDLVAQARNLLSAARHQLRSNPKPAAVAVAKVAQVPLQLLQPTLAQSNTTVTRGQGQHHAADHCTEHAGEQDQIQNLDEQMFGEDDEVISPIKSNKSAESWDWTDAW